MNNNTISSSNKETENLLNRFISYAKTYSQSNSDAADAGTFPSTEQQKDFALKLEAELKSLGIENVILTKDFYIYAFIPASKGFEKEKPVCLISHMDTSEETSGKDVKPRIFKNYDGKVISYPNGNFILDPAEDKYLAKAALNKETIITSSGDTLLGADDKAGIAEIVTATEYLLNHPELKHGPFELIFSPDEETGHGMDKVPMELIKSKSAYTVDGGDIGELESECFNAFSADLIFTGKACHTGTARSGKMVNAVQVVSQFISLLPHNMKPETTEGYEPFIAPLEVKGGIEKAGAYFLLRAFSMDEIEHEKKIIKTLANSIALSSGAQVKVKFKQQYLNMKEKIAADKSGTLKRLEEAYKACGVEIVNSPIRGGTDGSRLTEMGIPTPNIFTGGHNFHSKTEWASLNQMAKAADILIKLLCK
ncbi:MAG: peptidase T [Treponema sp.]|nr:peptidase T [Treponema sp.]